MAVPWTLVKTEYIENGTSYENLAKRYGCTRQTISNRASKEGWTKQRNEMLEDTRKRVVEKAEKERENNICRISNQKAECECLLWEITAKKLRSLRDVDIKNVDTADLRRLQQIYFDMASGYTANSVGMAGEDDPLSKALDEIAQKLDMRESEEENAGQRETNADTSVSEDSL